MLIRSSVFIGIGFCYGGTECVVVGVSAHLNVWKYACERCSCIYKHTVSKRCATTLIGTK